MGAQESTSFKNTRKKTKSVDFKIENYLTTEVGQVSVLKLESGNYNLNQATVEYFVKNAELVNPLLIMWHNRPTLIIGKNQNLTRDVNCAKLKKHNVKLCRRKTGGRSDYWDEGNTVFCFINPTSLDSSFNFHQINQNILKKTLENFGISTTTNSDDDFLANLEGEEKKIGNLIHQVQELDDKMSE